MFKLVRSLNYEVSNAIQYYLENNLYKANVTMQKILVRLQKIAGKLEEEQCAQGLQVVLPVLLEMEDILALGNESMIADFCQDSLEKMLEDLAVIVFGEGTELADYWGTNRKVLREKYPEYYKLILAARDEIPDNYQIRFSRNGELVLDVLKDGQLEQLHSSINPWKEAHYFATNNVREDGKYCLYGFGLGYEGIVLSNMPEVEHLTIVEPDIYQLAIACSYCDLTELLTKENVTLVCEKATAISEEMIAFANAKRLLIWHPSVRGLGESEEKTFIEDLFVQIYSIKNSFRKMNNNFKQNINLMEKEVHEVSDKFQGKKMILAAGGPSLDQGMEAIKRRGADTVLVAVGKVAKALLDQGIIPDYVAIIDPDVKTTWQIDGAQEVPLISLATANAEIVKKCQAEKYIAFQQGFSLGEAYAKEKGYETFESGGSVATFCIDLGVKLGCTEIIAMGLDMGYVDERSHASGVKLGNPKVDLKHCIEVERVGGGTAYTSKTLDMYRKWIEEKIARTKQVRFVNASLGCRIQGMEEIHPDSLK